MVIMIQRGWREPFRVQAALALTLVALLSSQSIVLISARLVEVMESISIEPEISLAKLLEPGGRYHNSVELQKLAEDYRTNGTSLTGCFDRKFGNITVDLFSVSLKDVVTKYLSNNERQITDFEEIQVRIHVLIENLIMIAQLVEECLKLPPQYQSQYGLSSLSLVSTKEFEKSLNPSLYKEVSSFKLSSGISKCSFTWTRQIPAAFDWRQLGIVTPAKNQHTCGSCYIFSAIGALEAAVKRQLRRQGDPNFARITVDFCEQNVLSCLEAGCDGAELSVSMQYLRDVGVVSGRRESYQNHPTTCHKFANTLKADDYCYMVGDLNNQKLKILLLKYGPIAVGIDTPSSMQHLRGAFNTVDQCKKRPNHAVLLVGWTETHWIIKNSWSRSWGQDGFLYLRMTENACAINTLAGVVLLNRRI